MGYLFVGGVSFLAGVIAAESLGAAMTGFVRAEIRTLKAELLAAFAEVRSKL